MSSPDAWVDVRPGLKWSPPYAESKVALERFLLEQLPGAIGRPLPLRFASVYGLSPRMRFVLPINEFTHELALELEPEMFGQQFWRPYRRAHYVARCVSTVLKAEAASVAGQIFNMVDSCDIYQKQEIVKLLPDQMPDCNVLCFTKAEDTHDYRLSFTKIRVELCFGISSMLSDGVEEIERVLEGYLITDPDEPSYANVHQSWVERAGVPFVTPASLPDDHTPVSSGVIAARRELDPNGKHYALPAQLLPNCHLHDATDICASLRIVGESDFSMPEALVYFAVGAGMVTP